ncbi:hypothetical protein Y032_0332g2746 [Ancylostoma ceylanicum]|uniref:Uncharacterized protein n=1 Tax=Ancylostoma ceylanicum TaxID=53326 RepID=A0A016RZV8_9BILA|nr:hypothetical protein Y032_0332g2746 [Ancylostoma ceylanicum]
MSRHIPYSVGHLYDPFHLEGVKERAWGENGVIGREGDKGRNTTYTFNYFRFRKRGGSADHGSDQAPRRETDAGPRSFFSEKPVSPGFTLPS